MLAALPAAALLRGSEGAAAESTAVALRDLAVGGAAYGAISLLLVFLLGDAPLRDNVRRLARRLAPRRRGATAGLTALTRPPLPPSGQLRNFTPLVGA